MFFRCCGEMDKAKARSSSAATHNILANSAGLLGRGASRLRNEALRKI